MTDRQDINNLQRDVRTIDATNLQNKQWIDDLYDCRDDIGRIWASIVLLEGQNKVYQAQISKLQADLVLAQTTTTRALKRAKCSHNIEPRDTSLCAGPSQYTSPPSACTRSRACQSGSIITVKSASRSPSIEVISRPPTPYPATRQSVRATPVPHDHRECLWLPASTPAPSPSHFIKLI